MINYSTVHLATSRVITYCITIAFVNKCPKVDKLTGYTIISKGYDPTTSSTHSSTQDLERALRIIAKYSCPYA